MRGFFWEGFWPGVGFKKIGIQVVSGEEEVGEGGGGRVFAMVCNIAR